MFKHARPAVSTLLWISAAHPSRECSMTPALTARPRIHVLRVNVDYSSRTKGGKIWHKTPQVSSEIGFR